MRLHRLTVRAFGPFAGEQTVDFDELSDAGLFLLTGPTGAGKTTILDAVCFAVYGSVPGVRGVKALKSQHAAEDVRPEVVLDFSVRDRRFIVRRTPEWTRPKRRGDGVTTEHASATLVETTSGEDHFLSGRAQEVGHLLGELIGMQASQFVQVAMLPQGDFQKFLRASSQDRHEVLQHLFRTDRFSRIEDWVHDHSRSLRERAASGQAEVQRVLDTIADRAGSVVPEEFCGDALAAPGSSDAASAWAGSLLAGASEALAGLHAEHRLAGADTARARSAHDRARLTGALVQRRDEALTTLVTLETEAEAAAEAARQVHADDRAGRCAPLLRVLDDAVADGALADERRTQAQASLGSLLPDDLQGTGVTAAGLTGLEQEIRGRITRLQALVPREQDLHRARHDVAETEAAIAAARAEQEECARRLDLLPEALAETERRIEDARRLAVRAEAFAVAVVAARDRLAAAEAAEQARAASDRLGEAEHDARERALDARDRLQTLTARRLAGIAAELAGRLEPGSACQVCGSTEHPSLAEAATDAVTEAEQHAADVACRQADEAYAAAVARTAEARQRLAVLLQAAGDRTVEAARGDLTAAEEACAVADEAREAQAAAERERSALVADQQRRTAALHDTTLRVATLQQRRDELHRTVSAVTAEITDAAGQDLPPDHPEGPATTRIADLLSDLDGTLARVCEARVAVDAAEDCAGTVATLRAQADSAAEAEGFADVDQARAASLSDAERLRLQQLCAAHEAAVRRAEAVLDDPDIRGLGDVPAPDLASLAAALTEAEQQEATAARALHQGEDVVAALERHVTRLTAALTGWAPVRDEFWRADSMSRLVRGMSGDNQLQMRLSAYVLATRLDQVVAAANERLAHMRDQRYLLQRTGRAARKGTQAGLGLEVVDQWTGDVREPTTLSGGETFVVSLSLALGLADVVTQEAGGTEIETLFVDEGFGTLDAETLDDVMDRLDDLRAGGRAVGVVSHVSELRNRIPTQLHVEKHRTGSVVTVRTAVG
jgi:exonuclease SbcC